MPGRLARSISRSNPGIGPLVIAVGLVVVPVGMAVSVNGTTYDTWGGFIWAPVLLALAIPLCHWTARRSGEPAIAGFLFGAAALKVVVGSTARYYMVDALYGAGDSIRYDRAGAAMVDSFRRGVFEHVGKVTGTRFIEILSGIVQAVIGRTMVGAFFVFSAFGFVGACLIYVAFCEALPSGDKTLYRRLLFLTPTLWFWPSSIGKEGFLLLCVGATSLGVVRLFEGRLSGLALAPLGMWGATVVRPHIALMLMIGVGAALPGRALRRESGSASGSAWRQLSRLLIPLVLLAGLPALLGSFERFFDIQGLNVESATAVRDDVVRRTAKGGSEFTPADPSTPVGLAEGVVTVAFRPYPWEAGGFQALASAESVVLMGIFLVAIARRRLDLLRALGWRWPRFSLAYVLAFAWGFSAVGNFGILSRQRSLMLPFLFVLVCSTRRREPVEDVAPSVPLATVTRDGGLVPGAGVDLERRPGLVG